MQSSRHRKGVFFDGWFVCQQDYTKTIKQISTRLGKRVDFDPELTPLTFDADLEKRTDLGFFFKFLF